MTYAKLPASPSEQSVRCSMPEPPGSGSPGPAVIGPGVCFNNPASISPRQLRRDRTITSHRHVSARGQVWTAC